MLLDEAENDVMRAASIKLNNELKRIIKPRKATRRHRMRPLSLTIICMSSLLTVFLITGCKMLFVLFALGLTVDDDGGLRPAEPLDVGREFLLMFILVVDFHAPHEKILYGFY